MLQITGLNRDLTLQEIRNFREAMDEVANTFRNAGTTLFDTLQGAWFSPRAIEFSNRYSYNLYDTTVTMVEVNTDRIIEAVTKATNRMLLANGADQINYLFQEDKNIKSYYTVKTFGKLKEFGPNGEIGMDADLVTGAISGYEAASKAGLNALSNVPLNIDLYDKTGQLQASYTKTINLMKNMITNLTNDMITSLKQYITEEQNTLEGAVGQSVEAIEEGTSLINVYVPGQGSPTVSGFGDFNQFYPYLNSSSGEQNLTKPSRHPSVTKPISEMTDEDRAKLIKATEK